MNPSCDESKIATTTDNNSRYLPRDDIVKTAEWRAMFKANEEKTSAQVPAVATAEK